MTQVSGAIVLGPEDAPLIDALAAWLDRVQLSQNTKSPQPASAADHGRSA